MGKIHDLHDTENLQRKAHALLFGEKVYLFSVPPVPHCQRDEGWRVKINPLLVLDKYQSMDHI